MTRLGVGAVALIFAAGCGGIHVMSVPKYHPPTTPSGYRTMGRGFCAEAKRRGDSDAEALRLVRKLEVTVPAVRPTFRAAVIQGCRSALRDSP
jgi:hypothetical protein